jgi:hypothetical protein
LAASCGVCRPVRSRRRGNSDTAPKPTRGAVTPGYACDDIIGGGEIDSALWLTTEDLLVCPEQPIQFQGKTVILYKIINTDDDGEKIDAEKLR